MVFPTSNVVFGVFGFVPFVGAYCIRPVRHRMTRTANLRHNIAKRLNSGRMQYAPTEATVFLSGFYLAIQSSNFFIVLATGSQVAVKYHAIGTKQNMKRLAE